MSPLRVKVKIKNMAGLKKVLKARQRLIETNIMSVMKDKALPHLIDLIMKGYDGLSSRMDLQEDPTDPADWRSEFKAKLEQDLRDTFVFGNGKLMVKLGEKSFLGYDRADDKTNEPLIWLVYYIEGLAGSWAFITPELWQQKHGGQTYPNFGRFAQGFLISEEDFFAERWDALVPFSQVQHPFSGVSPLDIFNEALNEFKIRPFIKEAIAAAARGQKV